MACFPPSSCKFTEPDTVRTLYPPAGCGTPALIASDGKALGVASSAPGTDSVCNHSGPYGSSSGPDSIFNVNGPYGSSSGIMSAYSTSTATPPVIKCANGSTFAHVSKSSSWPTAIDPDQLCATLQASGL